MKEFKIGLITVYFKRDVFRVKKMTAITLRPLLLISECFQWQFTLTSSNDDSLVWCSHLYFINFATILVSCHKITFKW
jgi:hypothetical protein